MRQLRDSHLQERQPAVEKDQGGEPGRDPLAAREFRRRETQPMLDHRAVQQYRDGEEWKEVRGRQGEAAAGRITFEGVETTGLRIEFEAPARSGSALAEWRTGQVQ